MTTADNKPKAVEPPFTELAFAYPFTQPGGKAFTDEREVRALLRDESAVSYLVGQSGLWHGCIHISKGSAGTRLDLEHGVRCIAKGEVVAYRINKTYPITEMPAQDTKPAVSAPFSTGFALVRHSMEYPRGQTLCFFTLYMHLQSTEEYGTNPDLQVPAYWDMEYQVTDGALDKPEAHLATGESAPASQVGLRVRAGPGHAKILAILPQLSKVQIGETKQKGQWGQLVNADVGSMYAPRLGDVADPSAASGWIFLGKEKGMLVVTRVLADAQVDSVVVLKKPFPINAGDLIGHMGQYDPVDGQTSNNRMVHIEAFCDDSIEAYLTQSRTYVDEHAKDEDHTIVRIDRPTKLYAEMGKKGANAPLTGVVAVYPVSVLASGPKDQQALETVAGTDKKKAHWWKVDSADGRLAPISGWVRETNHALGRVTLEAPHQWVDFQVLKQAHDPTHTMFASASAFMDFRLNESVPNAAALDKLSPLAGEIYRVAFPSGAGENAADELPHAYTNEWRQLALSRLVVKHESEWANPAKWDDLFEEMETRASAKRELPEERKRIDKLVWWDDVAGKVEGFPSSAEVFHLNAVALVGNFRVSGRGVTLEMLRQIWPAAIVPDSRLSGIADEINSDQSTYKLDTEIRLTHFFAQVQQEAGPACVLVESLRKYRAERLMTVFGYFRKNPAEASRYGYVSENQPANEEALANRAYEKKNGNGNVESGDGWKYRGRGLKQLTGRGNYAAFTRAYSNYWVDDVQDFVANPDLLSSEKYGTRSAIYFWLSNKLSVIADQTTTDNQGDSVNKITEIINKKTDSYDARRQNFSEIWSKRIFRRAQ